MICTSTSHACDGCGYSATVHVTTVKDGTEQRRHLCEECAYDEGIPIKKPFLLRFILDKRVRRLVERTGREPTDAESSAILDEVLTARPELNGLSESWVNEPPAQPPDGIMS